MRWLHDRSTVAKLLAAFALIYAVVAAGSLLTLRQAQTLKTSVDDLGQTGVPATMMLAKTSPLINQVVGDALASGGGRRLSICTANATKVTDEVAAIQAAEIVPRRRAA